VERTVINNRLTKDLTLAPQVKSISSNISHQAIRQLVHPSSEGPHYNEV